MPSKHKKITIKKSLICVLIANRTHSFQFTISNWTRFPILLAICDTNSIVGFIFPVSNREIVDLGTPNTSENCAYV